MDDRSFLQFKMEQHKKNRRRNLLEHIDENGVAYIFGADVGNGGAIFLDVATDPMNPSYLGEWDDYYIHDGKGAAMWINVARFVSILDCLITDANSGGYNTNGGAMIIMHSDVAIVGSTFSGNSATGNSGGYSGGGGLSGGVDGGEDGHGGAAGGCSESLSHT